MSRLIFSKKLAKTKSLNVGRSLRGAKEIPKTLKRGVKGRQSWEILPNGSLNLIPQIQRPYPMSRGVVSFAHETEMAIPYAFEKRFGSGIIDNLDDGTIFEIDSSALSGSYLKNVKAEQVSATHIGRNLLHPYGPEYGELAYITGAGEMTKSGSYVPLNIKAGKWRTLSKDEIAKVIPNVDKASIPNTPTMGLGSITPRSRTTTSRIRRRRPLRSNDQATAQAIVSGDVNGMRMNGLRNILGR